MSKAPGAKSNREPEPASTGLSGKPVNLVALPIQPVAPCSPLPLRIAGRRSSTNPSDIDTLVTLAESLDLDTERFAADLHSAAIEEALQADFHLRRKLQARSFPSLILESSGTCSWINRGWEETATVFARLEKALAPTPS